MELISRVLVDSNDNVSIVPVDYRRAQGEVFWKEIQVWASEEVMVSFYEEEIKKDGGYLLECLRTY